MTKVTIAVLTFNSSQTIERCLNAIYSQNLPSSFYDVLVLDNGSTDSTAAIVTQFPCSFILLPELSIAQLRNFAVSRSQAPFVAFVDSDCIIPPNWLRTAISWFDDPLVAVVGYKYTPPPNASRFERNWYGSPSKKVAQNDLIPAGNMIIRKSTFVALGGFHPNLITGEDSFYIATVRRSGYIAVNDPSLSSIHLGNPKSIWQFSKREVWYGLGSLNPRAAFTLRDRPFLVAHFVLLLFAVCIVAILAAAYTLTLYCFSLLIAVILASAFHRRFIKRIQGSFWYMAIAYIFYYSARVVSLLYIYRLKKLDDKTFRTAPSKE